MPLQQDFTDPAGVSHTGVYWKACQMNLDALHFTAFVTYLGFVSASTLAAKLQPIQGASKNYTIQGAAFAALALAAPSGATVAAVNANAADAYAMACQDIDTGTKDGNGNPIVTSFFQNATQVA